MSYTLDRALDLLEKYNNFLDTYIGSGDEMGREEQDHIEVAKFLQANGREVDVPNYPDRCFYCATEATSGTMIRDGDGDCVCEECAYEDDDESCEECGKCDGYHTVECSRCV